MEAVTVWAVAIGSGVFALGMISAIGSRRQRKRGKYRIAVASRNEVTHGKIDERHQSSAISMAAGGTGNVSVSSGEESLASVGSSSR
jgi:hypothetical protein